VAGIDLMRAQWRWPVEGAEIMSEQNHGSTLDDLLREAGIFEESQVLAIKEVVAWQLADAMQQQSLSKSRLAALLGTSRSQVDRLLDPTRDVTLSTLQRAAALLGRKIQIQLV
jgi:predicted XRE-type DNA-binding protein